MPRVPRAWARLVREGTRAAGRTNRFRRTVSRRAARAERVDPAESARAAGLRYVNDRQIAGIRRAGRPGRFHYVAPDGRAVTDRAALARIRSLAIPPAWTDVWICPWAAGHVQATGRDARGRKQYRYHARWRDVRDETKYGRLTAFARALPRIRRRTAADLKRADLSRECVLAAIVQLLEKTLIRIGNDEYARENRSYGLTTMRGGHARVAGSHVRFLFRGKSGVEHAVDLDDAGLARIVRACRELPGHELFQYLDRRGRRQAIDSADVNEYLRDVTGCDFTAKDFRTWAGTVLAARALAGVGVFRSKAESKRRIAEAVEAVARRLGNTRAVCRKCYIHPAVIEAYQQGVLPAALSRRSVTRSRRRVALREDEAAVVALLEGRLAASLGETA